MVWVGTGYTVHRKTDDVKMTDIVHSANVARELLINLYPKRVG